MVLPRSILKRLLSWFMSEAYVQRIDAFKYFHLKHNYSLTPIPAPDMFTIRVNRKKAYALTSL